MRERERRQSECSSNVGNEGATARVQGETSSAGDVASESSLPDIQVSANYNCIVTEVQCFLLINFTIFY